MALLDKFNDWYVRSIPETEEGKTLVWFEPTEGARYRWQTQKSTYIFSLLIIFIVTLVVPSKSGAYPTSIEFRFWLALGITALFGFFRWLLRNSPQRIVLTPNQLLIGQGRRPKIISLHDANLFLEERDGHPVLIVKLASGDFKRVYLDPAKQTEARDLLTKAGRL